MSVDAKRRYFIGHDSSGHRYIVPLDCRDDWLKWCDLPDDDEDGWEVPDHIDAIRIDGEFFHFCEPTVIS